MSLAEQIASFDAGRPSVADKLNVWIESLPDSEREIALMMLNDDIRFSNHRICMMFRAEGYPISKDTIARWRKDHNVAK